MQGMQYIGRITYIGHKKYNTAVLHFSTGRVLIRFSKDLYFLDNVISRQLFDLLDVSYIEKYLV